MADDLSNRSVQDRARISLTEPHEVKYWTQALSVTKEELERMVSEVGHSAAAVHEKLNK